ncbi:MAG: ABC transporter ATP-binding protein, partial [Chloroflexi bacterium]
DEPTNHLDIPSQEALQAALEAFGGTILMVTHDRYLVDRLGSQVWELKNGKLRVYTGNYQQYLAIRDQETLVAKEAAAAARAANKVQAARNGGLQLSKNEQRRRAEALSQLENQIAETEAKLHEISHNLQKATEAQSFDKIQNLSSAYAETETALEDLMAQWETLADE